MKWLLRNEILLIIEKGRRVKNFQTLLQEVLLASGLGFVRFFLLWATERKVE
jgi:hypothetical protein